MDRGSFCGVTGAHYFELRVSMALSFKVRVDLLWPALFCPLRTMFPRAIWLLRPGIELGSLIKHMHMCKYTLYSSTLEFFRDLIFFTLKNSLHSCCELYTRPLAHEARIILLDQLDMWEWRVFKFVRNKACPNIYQLEVGNEFCQFRKNFILPHYSDNQSAWVLLLNTTQRAIPHFFTTLKLYWLGFLTLQRLKRQLGCSIIIIYCILKIHNGRKKTIFWFGFWFQIN